MAQQQPAGWYSQPDGTQRYWDGGQWTNHAAAGAGAPPTPVLQQGLAGPNKPWFKKKRIIIPAVAVSAIAAMAIGGGGGTNTAAPVSSATSLPVSSPSAQVSTKAAAAPSREPDKTQGSSITVAQGQAVQKAQSYLEFSPFSRSGLIKQLQFEGFSAGDATFAVDHTKVDWMEQAARKAKQYLDTSAFSRASLIKQLTFEGFTRKQAAHGADSVGL